MSKSQSRSTSPPEQTPAKSMEEIAIITRGIANILLERNPDGQLLKSGLLKTEGIFRMEIQNTNQLPDQITAAILADSASIPATENVHEYTAALKRSIRDPDDKLLIDYSQHKVAIQTLQAAMTNNTLSDTAKGQAMADFVKYLASSQDIKTLYLAEVLHTYLHLAHQVSQFSEDNKMSPSNLAVVPVGPFVVKKILTEDPMEQMSLYGTTAPLLSASISSNFFERNFESTYPNASKILFTYESAQKLGTLSRQLADEITMANEIASKIVKKGETPALEAEKAEHIKRAKEAQHHIERINHKMSELTVRTQSSRSLTPIQHESEPWQGGGADPRVSTSLSVPSSPTGSPQHTPRERSVSFSSAGTSSAGFFNSSSSGGERAATPPPISRRPDSVTEVVRDARVKKPGKNG